MLTELPPDLRSFVSEELAQGRFESETELMCAALRLLQSRRLARLRDEIQLGLANPEDDLEFADEDELAAYLDQIDAEVDAEMAKE